VDHERGKIMVVRFGLKTYRVGKSQPDGFFRGTVALLDRHALENGLLGKQPPRPSFFSVALPSGSSQRFQGEMFALEDTGLSVISDIDDTIKITEVRDRNATLRNTFLREFQPVPGMAELYQRLAREHGAQFHYISASPWQLYEPLAAFVKTNGFPPGTFELKDFRWKSRKFFSLLANPEKYKSGVIEPLLKQFPKRRFILIGDSGERDPEIYASLARKYPQQIERIYIRDVTDEPATAERYTKAFTGIPIERWQVFREPAEIQIPATP
jgi:phosphatidate phosphatase APP1